MPIKAVVAEMFGTFAILMVFFATWLLVPGAALSSWLPAVAIGIATTAITYGLGQVSGGHFNPAITIGLIVGNRFDIVYAPAFLIAQVLGAILAAGAVLLAASDMPADTGVGGADFAQLANRFDVRRAFALPIGLGAEILLSAILIVVFMGATSHTSLMPLAPVAIGLGVTMTYLIAIPLTKAGLNPARSTAAALFAGLDYIGLLWMFWIAPIFGACLGGLTGRYLLSDDTS